MHNEQLRATNCLPNYFKYDNEKLTNTGMGSLDIEVKELDKNFTKVTY